jgi:hypothetical protein
MSTYGWLTESALLPKKSKALIVDKSSLMDMQVTINSLKAKARNPDAKFEKPKGKVHLMNQKNKGVDARDLTDQQIKESLDIDNLDPIKFLEKKAELYDKIKAGNSGMLKVASEKYLVDFDREATERFMSEANYESDRKNFYENLQKQANERSQATLDGDNQKHSELNEHWNTMDRQRANWEREALET